MGEGSLRKRKEQGNRTEDGQSIQSQEPQATNLKKEVNANTHSLICASEGLAQGGSKNVFVTTYHHTKVETALICNSVLVSSCCG